MRKAIMILSLIGGIFGLFGGACNFTGSACAAGTKHALQKSTESVEETKKRTEDEETMKSIAMKGVVGAIFSFFVLVLGPIVSTSKSKASSPVLALLILICGVVNLITLNINSGLIIFATGTLALINR